MPSKKGESQNIVTLFREFEMVHSNQEVQTIGENYDPNEQG
jgi:hypothetical protein